MSKKTPKTNEPEHKKTKYDLKMEARRKAEKKDKITSTIFRTVTPPWMKALNGVSIAVDTVFGLSVAFFAFALAYDEIPAFRKLFQKKKKE